METIKTLSAMRSVRRNLSASVGFVPTMGYLHEGHLSLVRQAARENETTVVSIFVNPTQFGPSEDFTRYPRDPERDLAMLEREKTDFVFMPSAEEMYPSGFNTWVEVESITERLEGAHRPGHFRGVTTVVAKLFGIVEPSRAYFGQKDAQQALVIGKMALDLNMNLHVITLPTVREPDGLAMSSRNIYLSPEERRQAPVLFQALTLAQELYRKGETNVDDIKQQITQVISRQPTARLDYVSIADPKTLQELTKVVKGALVSLAVHFGKTRLIDNVFLV